jgi:putative tricarboxylic transport membrane protein
MTSFMLRMTKSTAEYLVCAVFLGLSAVLLWEGWRLGPGLTERGPQPGFFPFFLTILMVIGTFGTIFISYRNPDRQPFFEASQEIVDLVKVFVPILIAVFAIRWLGIYLTSGIYIGLFMAWYGGFRWYSALAAAILLPTVLYAMLTWGFNIPMPMSMLYRQGTLPI